MGRKLRAHLRIEEIAAAGLPLAPYLEGDITLWHAKASKLWHNASSCGNVRKRPEMFPQKFRITDLVQVPDKFELCSCVKFDITDQEKYRQLALGTLDLTVAIDELAKGLEWPTYSTHRAAAGLLGRIGTLLAQVDMAMAAPQALPVIEIYRSLRARLVQLRKEQLSEHSTRTAIGAACTYLKGRGAAAEIDISPLGYGRSSDPVWTRFSETLQRGSSLDDTVAATKLWAKEHFVTPTSFSHLPETSDLDVADYPGPRAWAVASWQKVCNDTVAAMCDAWVAQINAVVAEEEAKPLQLVVVHQWTPTNQPGYGYDVQFAYQLLEPFGGTYLVGRQVLFCAVPPLVAEALGRLSFPPGSRCEKLGDAEQIDSAEVYDQALALQDMRSAELNTLTNTLQAARLLAVR